MKKTTKLLSVAIPLTLCLSAGVANANTVYAPAPLDSSNNIFTNVFSVSASDYVSEPSIFSDTINFSLDTAQSVSFFADAFSGPFQFHQIDLLFADIVGAGNYITGISQDSGPYKFSYDLEPGNYQVNYKGIPDGWNEGWNSADYKGVKGNYLAGISVNSFDGPVLNAPAVPEPETYLMLLAGLALIGVTTRRKGNS